MKILSVVGARPEFVKLAPLHQEFASAGIEHVIIHTGQHYDNSMSNVFFRDLGIPEPAANLGSGSGSHGKQTGAILAAMDDALQEHSPDWVIVIGDTNSTLAGALGAVKLHFPLAHVEAGLRSFNRLMPEEHNRILTDHAADLCMAPTEVAMGHLAREGLSERSVLVGDVNADVLAATVAKVAGDEPTLPHGVRADAPYYVATIHRQENVEDEARLRGIVEALNNASHPVVLAVHPRLRERAQAAGIDLSAGALRTCGPLPFPALIRTMQSSVGVITDSGGLQKEAFLLRIPCTTVRTETEWTETVDLGWNVLIAEPAELGSALRRAPPLATDAQPYGDGHAARHIREALMR